VLGPKGTCSYCSLLPPDFIESASSRVEGAQAFGTEIEGSSKVGLGSILGDD
jgi:hypothetical protein